MSEYRGFGGAALALALLVGGTLGACFALLYAPESGTRTRERIRRHTEGFRERVDEASEQGQEAALSTFEAPET
ncbi:MAG: YtxH domain-containing protein [Candidatus Methylomirabilales bacterium]|nr:YtxH domain-containing protein [candidate division NC10 bacterium]